MQLLSIIVPCYNVGQYIEECIDSLLNQSYKNLEIIAVNDGSTDNTLQVLRDKYNDRITIIDTNNMGVSHARNIALKKARGSFITFVDGDDWVDKDTYAACFNALKTNANMDVIQFPVHFFYNEHGNIISKRFKKLTSQKKIFKSLMQEKLGFSVWNKIYRKELIQDIIFPLNLRYEDMFFMAHVAAKAQNVLMIKDGLYYYRKVENSFINTPVTFQKINDYLRCRMEIYNLSLRHNSLIFERQIFKIKTFSTKEVASIAQLNKLEKVELNNKLKFFKPQKALCLIGFLTFKISLRKTLSCWKIKLSK